MAKKDVSVIVRGLGVGMSILQLLMAKVKAIGGTEEDVHRLATPEGETLLENLADLIVKSAKNNFRIVTRGNRTTEEVVVAGKYDWANSNINSQNFPMRPQRSDGATIELLEFDFDPTTEQVFAEARRRGLEDPVYEEGLFFGEQYPEKQRKRPVVFLHEPWQDPSGIRFVVVLYARTGKRKLNLRYYDLRWIRLCRFAFRRK